jgi:hypothetical protein
VIIVCFVGPVLLDEEWLTTEALAPQPCKLLGSDPQRRLTVDFRETLGEAFTVRVDQSRGACAGDGVSCTRNGDLARQSGRITRASMAR